MNASFGIDHPLLATHDINALRTRLISLGFNMTEIGKHPWGTSTSLAMFNGCLIEIMGIYDDSLIDEVPAGDFRFGRHVFEHLADREGVALSALHSTNSVDDASQAETAGFTVAGHLEFGRNVILPDGTEGRTKTTLALLPDPQFPRLSFFLCQQHRPDLIYVPEWLEHPNGVHGICGVNVLAHEQFHSDLKAWFGGIYSGFKELSGGFQYQTANGVMRVMTTNAFEDEIGQLPEGFHQEKLPCIAGMDLRMSDEDVLENHLARSGLEFRTIGGGFALTQPKLTANTLIRFLR
jgi:hypothetical protein